jgi:hypothetical protein
MEFFRDARICLCQSLASSLDPAIECFVRAVVDRVGPMGGNELTRKDVTVVPKGLITRCRVALVCISGTDREDADRDEATSAASR